jgi:hypothetical protein
VINFREAREGESNTISFRFEWRHELRSVGRD